MKAGSVPFVRITVCGGAARRDQSAPNQSTAWPPVPACRCSQPTGRRRSTPCTPHSRHCRQKTYGKGLGRARGSHRRANSGRRRASLYAASNGTARPLGWNSGARGFRHTVHRSAPGQARAGGVASRIGWTPAMASKTLISAQGERTSLVAAAGMPSSARTARPSQIESAMFDSASGLGLPSADTARDRGALGKTYCICGHGGGGPAKASGESACPLGGNYFPAAA